LLQTVGGQGVVNILAADKLMQAPKLYSTFLLWILSELYENLPEVGDLEKPKLVFFFDEAHILFKDAPKVLLDKIEQVVRLIRSKGVGVYFITQNPLDIPDSVLGQLGNRVQHALRAFTPRDQKAVKVAAETMRPNPKVDIGKAITELGVGEALVSFLQEGGVPGVTERIWVGCPGSQIGPITEAERKQLMATSIVTGVYDKPIDRESAYEVLQARSQQPSQKDAKGTAGGASVQEEEEPGIGDALLSSLKDIMFGSTGPRGGHKPGVVENMAKSVVRQASNQIIRGVLGSLLGKK
ncbi:helicase HerA-like domain-containing protein, partial [Turicimonas muris]